MKNSLIFDIEPDELEIFLDEVNEHMQVLETGILRLEQAADLDTLNAIFRAAHTIKALAGTVGHHYMADLTHTMENLFDDMRSGKLSANQSIVDDLLAAVDMLKILRDEIVTRKTSGIDVSNILTKLREIVEGNNQSNVTSNESSANVAGLKVIETQSFTTEQLAQIKNCQNQGQTIFAIEITTPPSAFAPAARLMQATMALTETSEIVVQQPSMADLNNNKHEGRLWLVIATQVSSDSIKELLSSIPDLAGFQIQSIQIEQRKAPTPATNPNPNSDLGTDKTVRISVERLDALMNLVGELVTNRNRLMRVEDTLRAHYSKEEIVNELNESSMHMSRVVDQLQEEVMRARMLPISHLFDKFPRIVRDVARKAGKQVDLVIEGGATELDRSLIEAIGDPLIHLLRNAVDHGIEPPEEREMVGKLPKGIVKLSAAHIEGHIVISIEDDGRGIDPDRVRRSAIKRGLLTEEQVAQLSDDEAADLIFEPNLSTAEKLTEVSGRGVGMDIVRTNVERLSGAVLVDSELGRGTTFRVTLPLTLAIVETMLVKMYSGVYALPLTTINDVLYLASVTTSTIIGNQAIRWRGSVLPLIDLRQFFTDARLSETSPNNAEQVIVSVTWGKQRVGLIVDKIIGKQGIVVKALSPIMGEVPGLSGGTILGDGSIALIIDVPSLVNAAMRLRRQGAIV